MIKDSSVGRFGKVNKKVRYYESLMKFWHVTMSLQEDMHGTSTKF